jgi:predicted  nucleic acid-binding Zn-ribbon protein
MKYGQTFREAYRQVRLKKEDNEVSMAVGQLKTMQDNLNQLMSILQSKGSDYELEAWVQSKITSANDKMTSATDYMKNSPSVSEDFDDINQKRGSEKVGAKGEVERLKDQVQRLKLELENEKNKVVKPEPNPDTGEVPLRTGVAQAILDKKGPKPNLEKSKKEKVKLSSGQSKVEVNPDVSIGQISGGNKASTGNLH